MGTVYSGTTSNGSYTYTRVRVDYDYSTGYATAHLLHSRTNSWTGSESYYGGTFSFGGGSGAVNASTGGLGQHYDVEVASCGFYFNTGGGYYSGSGPGAPYAFGGGVTIPAGVYTVSYNANGGTGAPSNQSKTHGVNLTLSSTRPTRANSSANGYTITFDPGQGTADYTTYTTTDVTAYTFNSWNTAQNGSGSSYQPGGTYSSNSNATMYAQWVGTTTKGKVAFPSATLANYSFLGWTRDLTTKILVTEEYVPTKNEILYAVYEVLVPDNPYTTSTALDNLEITSTSTSDITPFTGTISCVATLPIVRQLLYSFSNDNGTTWTNYQSSNTYNFTGLHEETEYTCRIRVKAVHQGVDSEDLVVTSNPFTFTTLADQAKLRRMINGQWKKGKAYARRNGIWVKAKKVYIQIDGQWKVNINNE